ncbi:alpha/beta-hydrolase [Mycena olivaceomarginata]|nr:alpha/beta-hydrolase [Mycena olivaceomarginata]
MDENNYKHTKTKRGFSYTPPTGKPILFFSHSFPSASFLWGKQVAFFQPLGYGIIVPDHLGYRGTDKPTDPKLYIGHGLAADMADILNAEAVAQVVAIGHDWGSYLVSRMLHYIPQRISACAFFALGYLPAEGINMFPLHGEMAQMVGYDVLAYQRFFLAPDAAALIEKNVSSYHSFISLLYSETPESWRDTICVDGGARAWVEGNKTAALPSYMAAEDKENLRTMLLSGGLATPLCWYKANVDEANLAEHAELRAAARREVAQPFLYVAFTKDIVALPWWSDANTEKYVKGPVTRKQVTADHWGILSHAAELNEILVEWIGGLALKL